MAEMVLEMKRTSSLAGETILQIITMARQQTLNRLTLHRFCCANAEMAHALRHWRYSLNQTVLQWLADDGQLTPAKIVERDSLRQKKRQKEANKVVDEMEATGVMRDLYRQFKENLEAARDSKVCCSDVW